MELYLRERSRSSDSTAEIGAGEDGSSDGEPDSARVQTDSTPASSSDDGAKHLEWSDPATESDAQSETNSLAAEAEHRDPDMEEQTTIAVSPVIGSVVERVASADDRFADDPETIVDTAVESFLSETVGSELDPDLFTREEEWNLSVECDPLLQRLLESTVTADDRFDATDDVVKAALSEYLDLQDEPLKLPLSGFDRYQILIDSLLANENYPRETVDKIIEVALEVHLLSDSESDID